MINLICLFILVLIVPLLVKDFRRSLTQAGVFKGLKPSIAKMEGLGERTNTRYCWFEIPRLKARLIAEISIERFNLLEKALTPATVVVSFLPFCRPRISHVIWQDEGKLEDADKTPRGFFAGLLYFLTGLAFLAWAAGNLETHAGQIGSFMALALLILSGYALMLSQTQDISPATLQKGEIRLLGLFKIGQGKAAFLILTVLCFAFSVVLFANLSLLAIILGLNTAMATGSFAYLYVKT